MPHVIWNGQVIAAAIPDAGWISPDSTAAASQITGHLAFGRRVTIEP